MDGHIENRSDPGLVVLTNLSFQGIRATSGGPDPSRGCKICRDRRITALSEAVDAQQGS
jgi:hypothetical protein